MPEKLENLTVTVAPTDLVVSLTVAKAQCEVDAGYTADDDLITEMIEAATEEAQNYTGLTLAPATYRGTLNLWPSDKIIQVPIPPLASVTSVSYYNEAGTLTAVDVANYTVITTSSPGQIQFKEAYTLPDLQDRPAAIEVVFVAGYAVANVPKDIKKAIRKKVFADYESRDDMANEKLNISDLLLGQYNGSGL